MKEAEQRAWDPEWDGGLGKRELEDQAVCRWVHCVKVAIITFRRPFGAVFWNWQEQWRLVFSLAGSCFPLTDLDLGRSQVVKSLAMTDSFANVIVLP